MTDSVSQQLGLSLVGGLEGTGEGDSDEVAGSAVAADELCGVAGVCVRHAQQARNGAHPGVLRPKRHNNSFKRF